MTAPPTRRQTATAAGLGLAIGTFFLWQVLSPGSVRSNDAYDYAQMGRELARGHGFTTLQVFPRHLPFLSEHGLLDGPWPNLHRYPLPTVLNAAGTAVFGDARTGAVAQSATMYLASVAAFGAVARRLAPLGVALVLTALFAVDPVVLSGASKGLTEGASMLWVIALIGLCARPEGMTRTDAALAGLTAGLAWLTRTQLAVLLPAAVVISGVRAGGWRASLTCVGGMLLATTPFWARNAWLAGDPLFSFSTSRNLALQAAPQDIDMLLDAPVDAASVLAENREAIEQKVWKNLNRVTSWARLRTAFAELSAWALAATGIASIAAARHNRTVVLASAWVLVATFLVVSMAFHAARFYDPMRPLPYLLLAAGSAALWNAVSTRSVWVRRGVAGAWLVCAAALFEPTVAQSPLFGRAPWPARADGLASLTALFPADTVFASDASARVALFADRRCIRLPILPDDLLRIDSDYVRIDAIVLTRSALRDDIERPTVFANYGRYREAVTTDAFQARWEDMGRIPGESARLYRRRQAAP